MKARWVREEKEHSGREKKHRQEREREREKKTNKIERNHTGRGERTQNDTPRKEKLISFGKRGGGQERKRLPEKIRIAKELRSRRIDKTVRNMAGRRGSVRERKKERKVQKQRKYNKRR